MRFYHVILLLVLLIDVSFAAIDPRLEQGARFAAAGEYEKAIGEYNAILATDPNNAQAYFAAAEVRFKMKDYSRALANYRLAYRYAPQMSEAYEGAARIYEVLGNKKGAADERAKDPANQPPVVEESSSSVELSSSSEIPVSSSVIPPSSSSVVVSSSSIVLPSSSSVAPVPSSATVAKDSSSKFSYNSHLFLKGVELFKAKKYNEVASIWREVLKQEPGHPGAYYYAGLVRYELGELDKAEYNLKRAFDFPELGPKAHYYLSLIYKKKNKKDLEIAELRLYSETMSSLDPKDPALARLAELTGTTDAVDSTPKTQVDSTPAVVDAVKSTPPEVSKVSTDERSIDAANVAFRKGDLATALSIYREFIENKTSDEEYSFALLQIGNIYRERRDFRSAVAKYREIVESYPNSDWANEAERAWEDAVWQEKNASILPRQNKR